MTAGQPPLTVTVRVAAGLIGAAAGLLWAFCAFTVVSSRFATDPAYDPHGYGLIFGMVLALGSGLVAAVVAPFAFPVTKRPHIMRLTTAAHAVCSALLITAWLTA